MWRIAVEEKLRTARPVVMEWWELVWNTADNLYHVWLKAPVMQRNRLKTEPTVPIRYRAVEDTFLPKVKSVMAGSIRGAIAQEAVYGLKPCAGDCLFRLAKHVQPKSLAEQDALIRRLTSPTPMPRTSRSTSNTTTVVRRRAASW